MNTLIEPTPTTIDELRPLIERDYFDVKGRFIDGPSPAAVAHDNLRRAGGAANVVLLYASQNFNGGDGEDFDTVVGDLLCDLMHLADALGVDFDQWLAKGAGHHDEEVGT